MEQKKARATPPFSWIWLALVLILVMVVLAAVLIYFDEHRQGEDRRRLIVIVGMTILGCVILGTALVDLAIKITAKAMLAKRLGNLQPAELYALQALLSTEGPLPTQLLQFPYRFPIAPSFAAPAASPAPPWLDVSPDWMKLMKFLDTEPFGRAASAALFQPSASGRKRFLKDVAPQIETITGSTGSFA